MVSMANIPCAQVAPRFFIVEIFHPLGTQPIVGGGRRAVLCRRASVCLGGTGSHGSANHLRPTHGQRLGVLAHMSKICSIVGLGHEGGVGGASTCGPRLFEPVARVHVNMLCAHLQARSSMEFVDSLLTNMLDLAKTQAGKLELEVKRSVLTQ